jgi:hypothetical protein
MCAVEEITDADWAKWLGFDIDCIYCITPPTKQNPFLDIPF